jgi:hypothetical protein
VPLDVANRQSLNGSVDDATALDALDALPVFADATTPPLATIAAVSATVVTAARIMTLIPP